MYYPLYIASTTGSSRSTLIWTTPIYRHRLVRSTTIFPQTGAAVARSAARHTAFRTTARPRCRSIARTSTKRRGITPAETLDDSWPMPPRFTTRQIGFGARRCAASAAPARTCTSIHRSSASSAASWYDANKKLVVTTEPAIKALEWYADLLRRYAPPGVENWNWPDIADAFGQGTLATYIDAHNSAGVINDPQKSKVIGKIGFARWPKGPTGSGSRRSGPGVSRSTPRCRSARRRPTWLFIQWSASKETQIATSYEFAGAYKRPDVNRTSLWQEPQYRKLMDSYRRQFPRPPLHPSATISIPIGVRSSRNGRRSARSWRPPSRPLWLARQSRRMRSPPHQGEVDGVMKQRRWAGARGPQRASRRRAFFRAPARRPGPPRSARDDYRSARPSCSGTPSRRSISRCRASMASRA